MVMISYLSFDFKFFHGDLYKSLMAPGQASGQATVILQEKVSLYYVTNPRTGKWTTSKESFLTIKTFNTTLDCTF